MPECVEVQVQVDGLKKIIGQKINLTIIDPGSSSIFKNISQKDFTDYTEESTITKVQRLGKYIIFELTRQQPDGTDKYVYMLVHLIMTGGFLLNKAHPHQRIEFELENDILIFKDTRKRANIYLFAAESVTQFLQGKLGLDALTATEDEIEQHLKKHISVFNSRTRMKTIYEILLDQSILSGLGNIYVNEALWRARINPRKQCINISHDEITKIALVIPEMLKSAYESGGSSIKDFTDVNGNRGFAQELHQVYGRDKIYCYRCPDWMIIKRKMDNGRSCFFCPKCQT